MDISVTDLGHRCLEVIRRVERTGQSVTIRRRGKIVAHLEPPTRAQASGRPWERLRALGGSLQGPADQSVAQDWDFEARR